MRVPSLVSLFRQTSRSVAFCCAGACFVACTVPVVSQVHAPDLILDSANIRQEGDVSFQTLSLGLDSRTDFPSPRFQLGQTDGSGFRLYLDVDSIQQVRFNAFTFTVYLANANDAGKGSYKYQVTGNPRGSFRDTPVTVNFHVKTGSGNVPGGIVMPVYNATRTDLLTAEKQTEPSYVSVSGVTPVQIRLSNGPDTLPVLVTNVAVGENCPNCWTRVGTPVNSQASLQIEPGANATLPIELEPNSIPALLHGALLIKSDVPHDTLAVTITYHTNPGGSDRKQTIPTQVRFGPGLIGLALALCAGVSLGLAARYLLTDRFGADKEKAVHAIVTAFVLGLIAECVGVMLTAYGSSKLILFGFDIDPRQLFPAFILAVLVSGGPVLISRLKDLFAKSS
jgi:hypothetical protein